MRFKKQNNKGFSLVELMIVVSIIGILAALAVPRFQGFQARAKSAEARTSLSHIYTLEQSYYGDNDQYTNVLGSQGLGFSLNGQTPASNGTTFAINATARNRYAYTGVTGTATAFTATAVAAVGNLGSCQTSAHTATINESKTLTVPSSITGC